MNYYK